MSFEIGQKVFVCWSKYKRVFQHQPSSDWGLMGEVIDNDGLQRRIDDSKVLNYYLVRFDLPAGFCENYSYYEDHLIAAN